MFFKKWMELLTNANMGAGFETFVRTTGKDMPHYFYIERAKSAGEFWDDVDEAMLSYQESTD